MIDYHSYQTSRHCRVALIIYFLILAEPEIPYHTELMLNPGIDNDKVKCQEQQSNIMLLYVYTAANNFKQRKRVRRTWASVSKVLLALVSNTLVIIAQRNCASCTCVSRTNIIHTHFQ